MEKETVIQLTNTSLKLVEGNVTNTQMISIDTFEEYAFMEGTMLDGAIMDEDAVFDVLDSLKKKGLQEARLVIDSGQILRKHAIVPKLKPKEVMQLCKNELNTMEGDFKELVYDYTILKETIKGQEGMEILCCAMEKEFIKNYIDIFTRANIKLLSIDISTNALFKLTSSMPELKGKTYAITLLNGNDVSSSLFVDNILVFTSRARLFSPRGSVAFVTEITTHISQLLQFNKTQNKDTNVEKVYFCGLDAYEEVMIYDVVRNTLDIEVECFVNSKIVTTKSTQPFALHQYVYAVGSLIRK